VLWGKHDKLLAPAYAEEFHKRVPVAKLETIDGAHMMPLEIPGKVAAAVTAFLK
jgi:pimeloyl-ACP methyl ester carboxylesterase